MSVKRVYDVKEADFVNATATAIIEGKFRPRTNICGPISADDHRLFARATGFNLEEFNAKMAERLASITEKIANKVDEKLENDEFKPGELAYAYSVFEDKRGALTGRTQLQTSQVNVQINNYGTERTKEEVLNSLFPPSINASVDHDVI